MLAVLYKEVSAFFNSAIAYVVFTVYLLSLGLFLWVFPDSSIPHYGYASLDSYFSLCPLVFMFFIPALTMRSIAEERKEGTFELLATRPLSTWQIIAGKYLASVLIMLLALIFSTVYYISVYQLGMPVGNIDTGAVIGSYIGLFLLGAAFVSIGVFASSLNRNQIVAFTVAVFLCFLLYVGLESLSRLLGLQYIDLYISTMGISAHYESLSRGVLDTRDLVYFLTLTGFFLTLSRLAIGAEQMKRAFVKKVRVLLISLVVLLALNIISSFFYGRIDFTADKRYTLSNFTQRELAGLEEPMHITVFLEGDFPAGFKRLRNSVKDLLASYKAYSGGNLRVSFVNPETGDGATAMYQELTGRGLEPTNLSVRSESGLSQKVIFPSALIDYKGRQAPVNFFQASAMADPQRVLNYAVQNLEYVFTAAIRKVRKESLQRVGFTEGHGELSDLQLAEAMKAIQGAYEVGRIDLKSIRPEGLKKLGLIVVPKPDSPFTELEKFKLDYFVMQGGSILWAIDQVSADLDSLRGMGSQLTFPKKLNLDDMLFRYGFRINTTLVADMNCARIPLRTGELGGSPQIQLVPWLFYPILIPASDHPLVRNLPGLRSEFVSTIDTIDVKGIKKLPILSSSPFNKVYDAPSMISLQMVEEEPDPATFRNDQQITGLVLEGQFPSAFANRSRPSGLSAEWEAVPAARPAKMIALADGDLLKNQISTTDGSTYPLGFDRFTSQQFGNRSFFQNAVDYLTDDAALIELRRREVDIRLLDRARLKEEKLTWQLINIVLPLALLFIFGGLQYAIRKRKYT